MFVARICIVQVSFVGATEEQARETAQKKGYGSKVAVVKTSFKANTKVCTSKPYLLRCMQGVHEQKSLLCGVDMHEMTEAFASLPSYSMD